ncbi:hypothetical protein BsWGS_14526 [Bradybaena similaris]
MKFRHRVFAVVVLGFLTLGIYVNLPDEVSRVRYHRSQQKPLQLEEQSDSLKQWLNVNPHRDPEMCSLTGAGVPHHANISTYDLYYKTHFDVKSNGEWEMPVPSMSDYKTDRLPKVNVFLLPHSHNDPGWLKTVNEYYSDQTKHILNNMVNKLTQFPNMTFMWTETVYFAMWWNELEDAVKVHVRRLIRRGQLEMTLGGWVMPDEASSHYVSVIDQLIEGHQWLWENLHIRPENSWSIDPFGYSSTMPYLWQKSGMSNMVIQRVHQAVKASLFKEKALEFYWRQMWDRQGLTDILCHVMPFMLYSIKYTCGPNPFICLHFDFRKIAGDYSQSKGMEITKGNLEHNAEMLYLQYRAKAFYFRHNAVLVPIGDDFRYDKEKEWDQQYENYEKLMQYINSRTGWNMNVQWGTLRDYFSHIRKQESNKKLLNKGEEFPSLSGDFFPYSDKDMAYWTGYYSTRAFDKSFGRDLQAALQAADILSTLHYAFYKKWAKKPDAKFAVHSSLLQQARRSLGLFLHHDGITGTSKSFVAEDYEQYLLRAFVQCQEVMKFAIQILLSSARIESPVVFQPETLRKSYADLPHKQVIAVQGAGTTVAFFNPVGQPRQEVVHLYVNTQMLEVISSSQQIVSCQVNPVWNREQDAVVLDDVFELTFVVEIGPFAIMPYVLYKKEYPSFSSYMSSITVFNTPQLAVSGALLFNQNRPEPRRTKPILIDNQVIQLTFDPRTGSLLQVMDLATKNVTKLNINFLIYKSQGSGAYIFYPQGPATNLFPNIPIIRLSQGPLATVIEIGFEPYVTHIVTLYQRPSHLTSIIFIENKLSIQTLKDKELIMRMNTNIQNSDLSYFTDQNGFQFIRRRTNRSARIETNYYPMTSAVVMEDKSRRLTLLAAQPHGVSCLETGQLEVMLDRQLVYDDDRGMGEGVTDIKTTISRFAILIEKRTSRKASRLHYASLSLPSLAVQDKLQQPLLAYFTNVDTDVFFNAVNPIASSLPCDVSAVNFRSLADGNLNYNGTSIVLHRRGYDCSYPSGTLLCPLTHSSLSFDVLFRDLTMSSIHETSLTHTIVKQTMRATDKISIAPMELASFHIRF